MKPMIPELPRYQSHKVVRALQIKSVEKLRNLAKLTFIDEGYLSLHVSLELFSRYTPVEGDYFIVYDDNYHSFSPKKAFEEGYTKLDNVKPMMVDDKGNRSIFDDVDE